VSSVAVTVRPTSRDDLGVIGDIYAHHVRTGVATFELTAPDRAEWVRRFDTAASLGLPFLTACLDGEIRALVCLEVLQASEAKGPAAVVRVACSACGTDGMQRCL